LRVISNAKYNYKGKRKKGKNMVRTKKLASKIATGNVEIQGPEDSIYSLVGYSQFPYKQDTQAEYESFIREMNLADLQRHAVQQGVIPNAVSRAVLTDRLVTKFLKAKFAFVNVKNTNPVTAKLPKKDEEDIANLLARGR